MNDEKKWTVTYTVPALTGDVVHRRGPYTALEAESHARDIWGYEGVVAGEVVPAEVGDQR